MADLRKALQSHRLVAAVVAAALWGALLAVRALGLLEPVELAVYDRLLTLRPEPEAPGERVVVVAYTEQDIMQQATYPLPDATLAQVLRAVLDAGARSVGVDFYRDVLIPPGSERLEALLESEPRVVMVHLLSDGEKPAVPPPAVLAGTDQTGFSDLQRDGDDTVRRALLYADDEQGSHFSLALRVALRYLAAEGVGLSVLEDRGWIALGDTPLPRFRPHDGPYVGADAHGYQVLLDFEGSAPFRSIPMSDVLAGRTSEADFRDKMVLVGATAESIADLRRVPFGLWPGIFVHGHIASRLVGYGLGEAEPLATLPAAPAAVWIGLGCLAGAFFALLRASLAVFLLGAAVGAAGFLGAGYAALLAGWWIPSAPPALGFVLSAGTVTAWVSRRESAERKVLMQLFERHVSRRLASELWEKRDQFLEGGRPTPLRLVATVFFVDVKSFTGVAEGLDPIGLMNWVNDLMGVLAQEVEDHGGFVDDYFGDGMKAAFGVPIPRESEEEEAGDARAAVRCALAMEARLDGLNEAWRERGMPQGALRVGIDSGYVVAGSMGSRDRLKYTVLGDVANTAARLESLDDSGHDFAARRVRILVSHRTHARLRGAFRAVDRGEFMLKGKAQAVRAYQILGPAAEAEQAPAA